MMSQKVSPEGAWVTIAIVIRGVPALPAEMPAASSSDFFPPELLEQPASARVSAAPTAMTGVTLQRRGGDVRFMVRAPHCARGERSWARGSRAGDLRILGWSAFLTAIA
jgi:hypothetical protein